MKRLGHLAQRAAKFVDGLNGQPQCVFLPSHWLTPSKRDQAVEAAAGAERKQKTPAAAMASGENMQEPVAVEPAGHVFTAG
jgi:hypothetical protein